jgi:hypothetical protein
VDRLLIAGVDTRARSRWAVIVACGTALMMLLGVLGGFVHLAREQHAVCVEHGETVHVEGEHPQPVAVVGVPIVGHRLRAAPPPPPCHEGHGHCGWTGLARHGAHASSVSAPVLAEVLPGVLTVASRDPVVAPPPSGRALVRLAPKTSPPA